MGLAQRGHQHGATARFALTSGNGVATGQASDQETPHGWQVKLAVKGLPDLGETGFYECWYVGAGDRPGHPNRVSAGTFNVDSKGRADVRMWGWADPRKFTTMQITREPADGDPVSSGTVVLHGSIRT